jgi:hypothetical protein
MKKIVLLLLSVGLLAANVNAEPKKPKPRFPLGKETTYVTEPLDAGGYIDYAAALNERLRRGVTPENNANVLLWKAFGPCPEGRKMPEGFEEYFKWLGIKPPPEKGDYFLSRSRYLKEHLKIEQIEENHPIYEESQRCSQRPWAAKECPNIVEWLKANEKPLALVVEATRRTHYYCPLIPNKKNKSGLIGALMPSVQKCRELANALTCRAMLRLGEGRFDDAWQDLLACHRLSRLVARGATNIELLVAIAIDAVASRADLAFLERVDWKAERLNNCLRELRKLLPMSLAAEKVDLGERFISLEAITMIDRYGPEYMEGLSGSKEPNLLTKLFQPTIDYEPVLPNINRWYNRMAKAMRVQDRATREKQLNQIGKELDELNKKSAQSRPGIFQIRKAVGEKIGNIMIGLLVPAIQKVQNASDRCEQIQNNLYLAFALAAYHRDHGRYPKELETLAPKYLDKVPMDLFSGKPLIYRPSENGYVLYSVGINGQDEQGQSSDDEPPGDDLVVRMPLPKLKQP